MNKKHDSMILHQHWHAVTVKMKKMKYRVGGVLERDVASVQVDLVDGHVSARGGMLGKLVAGGQS